jgi:hypothetical protein
MEGHPMKSRLLASVLLMSWFVLAGSAKAAEPDLEFAKKLREKDVRDFATANSLATISVKVAQEIKQSLDVAIKNNNSRAYRDDVFHQEEIDKLKVDYSNALKEAERNFELAFSLASVDDDKQALMNARLFYAYTEFWLRKNYEAAVLAEHVARTADNADGTVALNSAYLAMAALVQAFSDNKSPLDQKGADMRLVVQACNRIADRMLQALVASLRQSR